jgi:WxcM-like, C-terminal
MDINRKVMPIEAMALRYTAALHLAYMAYSHDAVQLVLANTDYDAADYIRDYDDFVRLRESVSST